MTLVRFSLFCSDTLNEFLDKNCPYIAGSNRVLHALLDVPAPPGHYLGVGVPEPHYSGGAARTRDAHSRHHTGIERLHWGRRFQASLGLGSVTGIVSILGLLWAATVVFGAIRKGINAAWGITKPRPFLKERLIDFGLVIGAGILLLAVLFSPPTLGIVRGASGVLAPESEYFNHAMWNVIARLILPRTGIRHLSGVVQVHPQHFGEAKQCVGRSTACLPGVRRR